MLMPLLPPYTPLADFAAADAACFAPLMLIFASCRLNMPLRLLPPVLRCRRRLRQMMLPMPPDAAMLRCCCRAAMLPLRRASLFSADDAR